MIPRLYILLGRTGDIISLLPLLRLENESGRRPALMVAKEYAGVMEGVSYCDCVEFDGPFDALDAAVEKAKTLAEVVKCVQITGPPDQVKRQTFDPANAPHAITDSFQKEVWRFMGQLDRWKDQPPLVFDRRDAKREAAYYELANAAKKKKIILYALGGTTNPFPYPDLCVELLKLKFPKACLIDLSAIKAERIYDLLALYERAHCLVACDSAPLHLAHAVPTLPVVALIADKPALWHGSAWRANHIAHIRYSDFPKAAVEMLSAIEGIGHQGCRFMIESPRYIRLWSSYEINAENESRALAASDQWSGKCVHLPFEVGAAGQDSGTVLKDEKRYPMVKDVVRAACMVARDDDTILLTRCDTSPDVTLFDQLANGPLPAYAHRTLRNGDGDTFHPAVDLFAFTKAWWNEHSKEFPPMLLAMDNYWNRVMLDLFTKYGARMLPFAVWREPGEPISIAKDAPPRLVYNENQAQAFWKKNASTIEPPMVIKQASGGFSINRHAINPYSYNPSILKHNGRLLMAYRWHPDHELRTHLAVAELHDNFSIANNKEVRVAARSAEDPRLFEFKGDLYVSFVDSTFPDVNPKCVTRYGKLREYPDHWAVEDVYQPVIGQNDWTGLEKNLVFWEHGDVLMCRYQSWPEQIVYQIEGDKAVREYRTPGLRWPWGTPRGGTRPFPYKDRCLRFFHSGLDNEPQIWRRRYYVGAMLCEDQPPFTPVAISREPILRGSEKDDLSELEMQSCLQYKAKVVFPCGAIEHDGGWMLSVGVNDAACALVKITERDLHL